jgi:hypothetical protein
VVEVVEEEVREELPGGAEPAVASLPLKRTVSPNQDYYGVPLPK